MASAAVPVARTSVLDETGKFFWEFLKDELTPYPGRLWVVGRVTIAASIVMLIVMTFQLPGGFLGAIFTLFLSRETQPPHFVAVFLPAWAFWPPPCIRVSASG